MKQIRFQPLASTYQTLSTLLSKTALSIQTTDYTATEEWTRFIQQVKHTLAAFKTHADKEENILFPQLHHYEPALVAILRDAQYQRLRYLSSLYELLASKQLATDKHKSMLFSHKLLYRMDEFVAAIVQEMKEHEPMINAVLWKYYSDKELVALAASFTLTPSAKAQHNHFAFADSIINNIVPTTMQSGYKSSIGNKVLKHNRATKELASAI